MEKRGKAPSLLSTLLLMFIVLLCACLIHINNATDLSNTYCDLIFNDVLNLIFYRRFFSYMIPFRSATAAYAYGSQAFSMQLAYTHPELTLPPFSQVTDYNKLEDEFLYRIYCFSNCLDEQN